MITREPTIERLAIAQGLMLEPFGIGENALQQALADAGVGTLIHYPIPPHRQQAYAQAGWQKGAFPLAERMADQVLSLPIGPHLQSDQVDIVIAAAQKTVAAV